MPIRFQCPNCTKVLKAPERAAATKVRCPKCNQKIWVPPPVRDPAHPVSPTITEEPAEPPYADVSDSRAIPIAQPKTVAFKSAANQSGLSSQRVVTTLLPNVLPSSLVAELIPSQPSAWFWRYCSPSMLLLSLCLLPLPFIQVGCSGPAGETVIITQSGLQSMYGGFSTPSLLANAAAQRAKVQGSNEPIDVASLRQAAEKEKERVTIWPSGVMLIIPFIFCMAAVGGLLLRLCLVRSAFLAVCVGFASLLIFGQMAWGFPIESALARSMANGPLLGGNELRNSPDNQPWRQAQDNMARDTAIAIAALIHVRYTVWFYIWLLLVLGSLVPVILEAVVLLAKSVHPTLNAVPPILPTG